MTGRVHLSAEDGIAVIRIDNPPVNALSHALRSALCEALEKARTDPAVAAIVVTGSKDAFCGGADIAEFDKPAQSPTTHDVIALVDTIEKPTIAAIAGVALGGGLELALAFHFRVAAPDARLGLPEVKLGLLPGAGGTQRLPRAIGMEEALRMIVTGEPVGGRKARELGLVEIAAGDLAAGAVAFARQVLADKRPLTRLRDRDDRLGFDPATFDALSQTLTRRLRGLEAPAAGIEALRGAVSLSFDEAVKAERALFMKLLAGDQSKAQRHLFFAERAARKVPDMPAEVKSRKVERAAIIGAGTMGGGIAMAFASAGIPVTMIDASAEALEHGLGVIASNYRSSAAKGALAADEAERRIGRIQGATNIEAASDADLIIEAVFEDMALKRTIFRRLDQIARAGTVLATNTSTLDVDAIAAETRRPGDVVGMHFFSPANVMKLLEIVRGKATAHDTLKTAMAVGQRIGKVGVVSGVCYGFIGNRMLARREVEMERLMIEGALPQEIDAAVTEFGLPMGPCAMSDLAGIDVSWRIRQSRGETAPVSDALHEAGRHGQKTGKGYYLYEPGSRTPVPDPEVEALILATSKRLGVERRAIGAAEIVERTVYPMINEGARILEEGIAMRPGDIDVVWVYGYGWPAWRGGPMFHADRIGLAAIAERLSAYSERIGDASLRPAPLLTKLAAEGLGFSSLAAKA